MRRRRAAMLGWILLTPFWAADVWADQQFDSSVEVIEGVMLIASPSVTPVRINLRARQHQGIDIVDVSSPASVEPGSGCVERNVRSTSVRCTADVDQVVVVSSGPTRLKLRLGELPAAVWLGNESDFVRIKGGGDITLAAGGGNDDVRIVAETPEQEIHIFGGEGDDRIRLSSRVAGARLEGGPGNDWLRGGWANDRILGGEGEDVLEGDKGEDYLTGGPGSDTVRGGPGEDVASYTDSRDRVVVTFDGVANDGEPGEGDNVLPDVEALELNPNFPEDFHIFDPDGDGEFDAALTVSEEVWSGQSVNNALFTSDRVQVAAWYEPGPLCGIALAVRFLGSKDWARHRIDAPNLPCPRDKHHDLQVHVDQAGLLHLAGNMHNDPMAYFRTTDSIEESPAAVSSLRRETLIAPDSIDEPPGSLWAGYGVPGLFLQGSEHLQKVTYPVFRKLSTGALQLRFRTGHSGFGDRWVSQWDPPTRTWSLRFGGPLTTSDPEDLANSYGPIGKASVSRTVAGGERSLELHCWKPWEHETRSDPVNHLYRQCRQLALIGVGDDDSVTDVEGTSVVLPVSNAETRRDDRFPQSPHAVPVGPADFDGDHRADPTVYDQGRWTWRSSLSGDTNSFWRGGPDSAPVVGDFDGDGVSDPGAYHQGSGTWQYLGSATGSLITPGSFGGPGFEALSADFDGDGIDDRAVFRSSTGTWKWQTSADGHESTWDSGLPGGQSVVADFDGDSLADPAVWHSGELTALGSLTHQPRRVPAPPGVTGDSAIAGDLNGDGVSEAIVVRSASWHWLPNNRNWNNWPPGLRTDKPFSKPLPGGKLAIADYDGDGFDEAGIFDNQTGTFVWRSDDPESSRLFVDSHPDGGIFHTHSKLAVPGFPIVTYTKYGPMDQLEAWIAVFRESRWLRRRLVRWSFSANTVYRSSNPLPLWIGEAVLASHSGEERIYVRLAQSIDDADPAYSQTENWFSVAADSLLDLQISADAPILPETPFGCDRRLPLALTPTESDPPLWPQRVRSKGPDSAEDYYYLRWDAAVHDDARVDDFAPPSALRVHRTQCERRP